MTGMSRLPTGFEDLLRGGLRANTGAAAEGPGQQTTGSDNPVATAMDVQQLSDMLNAQFGLREAAQAGKAQAVRALVATAEALCPNQWDSEKRAGHSPEDWPPERIGEFVIRHTMPAIQRGYLAQRPGLAEDYEKLSGDLSAARDEINRLKLQLHHAQEMARTKATTQAAQLTERNIPAEVEATNTGQPRRTSARATPDRAEIDRKINAVPTKHVDAVIKSMATTGLSRSDKVRAHVAAKWGVRPNGGRVGYAVRAAERRGLIDTVSCTVGWKGETTRTFLVLTPAGQARAEELGVALVESEFTAGIKLHKTASHLYLVLKTSDILRAEGFEEVNYLPRSVEIAGGEYCPDITARQDDSLIHVECERSQFKQREIKWSRAAEANNGRIYLVTPNLQVLNTITSEIAATTGSEFEVWAFSITEYAAGGRGEGGAIWTYRR